MNQAWSEHEYRNGIQYHVVVVKLDLLDGHVLAGAVPPDAGGAVEDPIDEERGVEHVRVWMRHLSKPYSVIHFSDKFV